MNPHINDSKPNKFEEDVTPKNINDEGSQEIRTTENENSSYRKRCHLKIIHKNDVSDSDSPHAPNSPTYLYSAMSCSSSSISGAESECDPTNHQGECDIPAEQCDDPRVRLSVGRIKKRKVSKCYSEVHDNMEFSMKSEPIENTKAATNVPIGRSVPVIPPTVLEEEDTKSQAEHVISLPNFESKDNKNPEVVKIGRFSKYPTNQAESIFPAAAATSTNSNNNNNIRTRVKAPFIDEVTVTFFHKNGKHFKVKLSLLQLSAYIDERVKIKEKARQGSLVTCVLLALLVACLPAMFHIVSPMILLRSDLLHVKSVTNFVSFVKGLFHNTPTVYVLYLGIIGCVRFTTSGAIFFLLAVAERAYTIKYIYAKYFAALTSTRRAKRNRLPHFRLHKVQNIKVWFSLRSYIKKSGPVRSVELIVSATFFVSVSLIIIMCYVLLSTITRDTSGTQAAMKGLSKYERWESLWWGVFLSYYLLRFVSLGSEIHKQFQNQSELIMEQVNLYLKMQNVSNPKKREELMIANNVLKLASKLLKELEPSKRVSVFLISPFILNLMRVIFLSFFSALVSELFGIRFKGWKIGT